MSSSGAVTLNLNDRAVSYHSIKLTGPVTRPIRSKVTGAVLMKSHLVLDLIGKRDDFLSVSSGTVSVEIPEVGLSGLGSIDKAVPYLGQDYEASENGCPLYEVKILFKTRNSNGRY